MTNETNLNFLRRLQGIEGITEISDLYFNIGGLEHYEDALKLNKDLYFIAFTPNEQRHNDVQAQEHNPRTKNNHISGINYFKADFDIRSYVFEHEYGKVLSNKELMYYKDVIMKKLSDDKLLCSFNAVIFSGNGFHFYWIGERITPTPTLYATASAELYNRIKKLFPNDPQLRPDFACGNIGRLMRMPGSYNTKTKYGLPPQKVEVLEYYDFNSTIADTLLLDGEMNIRNEERRVAKLWKSMNQRCKNRIKMFNENGLFQRINEEIDIAGLVCDYTGWELSPDGINFISNRDGKNTGAYLIPEENVVVHMGTPHLSDYFRVYSPFSFIMVHYADGDAGKTFEIAREMYPDIKQKGRFYFEKED